MTPDGDPRAPARRSRDFAWHVLPAVVWAVLVFVGGGSHAPEPELDVGFPLDKLEHAVAFLVMQLLAFRALRYVWPERSGAKLAWSGAAVSVGFGVLLELYQLGLPHRSAEFGDVAADSVGAVVGALSSYRNGRKRTAGATS